MKRGLVGAALAVAAFIAQASAAETVKVAWCARTVTSAAAPFAIANKMGWFTLPTTKTDPLKVELVPLAGSVDCVKYVGTGEVRYALPSVEPLAALRPQGVKAKVFYTAYQGNIYGIAVPDKSAARRILAAARRANPGIDIVVRTHSGEEADWLARHAVGLAVMGERHAASEMANYALKHFRTPPE